MYNKTYLSYYFMSILLPILAFSQTNLTIGEAVNIYQDPRTSIRTHITLDGPCELNILVEGWQNTPNSGMDFDRVYMYGPSMEPIGIGPNGTAEDPFLWQMLGDPANLVTPVSQAGTYTIDFHSGEIYGWPTGQTAQSYSVLVTRTLVPDTFEPNDDLANAAAVDFDTEYDAYQWKSIGYTSQVNGDNDYYKLILPSPGTIEVTTNNWVSTYSSGDVDKIYCYNENGEAYNIWGFLFTNPEQYFEYNLANGPKSLTVAGSGVHYMRLYSGDGVSMDPYQVTFRFTPNPTETNSVLNVPADYNTIQAALNLADPGDTVLVQPGIYFENILWPYKSGLNLVSAGNPSNTVIDGNHDHTVIEFLHMFEPMGDTTNLIQGFRITHGAAAPMGGGLNLELHRQSLTLRNVEIVDNWSDILGGGIYIQGGSVIMDNVIIANNYANENGGGISMIAAKLNAINLTLAGNRSDMTAAGLYALDCDVTITESTIHNNVSEMSRNAIEPIIEFPDEHMFGDLTINTSNFRDNEIAVNNLNLNTSDLTNNYWGHEFGPLHMDENPSGQGETVTGIVSLSPWLASENTSAPMLPPQTMDIDNVGDDFISLSWSPSSATDLAGYRVYYNTNMSGSPYSEFIDVGLETSYVLQNVSKNTVYYIAVSAVDLEGNRSWYSEEVSAYIRKVEIQNLGLTDESNLQRVAHQQPKISYEYLDIPGMVQELYQFQVTTDPTYSIIDMWDTELVGNSAQRITYAGQALLDANTYYLRARAGNEQMLSEWAYMSFRMNSSPDKPILDSPVDGVIIDSNPLLAGSGSSDSDGDTLLYQFKVYEDVNLSTLVDSSQLLNHNESGLSWQVETALKENGQYFWHLGTTDSYEWSYSEEIRSFIFDTGNDPPNPFILLEPKMNRETGLLPTFYWEAAIDPDPAETICSYTLYLDTPEPGILIYEVGLNTFFTLVEPLADNAVHHWKVVARDEEGLEVNNVGDYQTFVTNTTNDIPTVVDLISPDSVIVLTLLPELYWTEALDKDLNDWIYYEVQWWKAYDHELDSVLTSTNSVIIPRELEDNSQYFWQVLTRDNNDGISHSSQATFWTDLIPQAPIGFALINPSNNTTGLSTTPVFLWEHAIDPDPLDFVTYTIQIARDSSFSDMALEATDVYHVGLELELSNQLEQDSEYWWKVIATDTDSLSTESEIFKFTVGYVSVAETMALPTGYILQQNFPNPFNPSTTLRYGIPEEAKVSLIIYDIRGNTVKIYASKSQPAGWYTMQWNGISHDGTPVGTGVYFARLQAGDFSKTIKMVYLR